jgi:hypothetical protein
LITPGVLEGHWRSPSDGMEIAGMQACDSDVLQQDGIDAWMKVAFR